MAVKRIITKVPIEPFHLNQYSPGCLQMPNSEDIWTGDSQNWKSSFLLWKNHGYTNDDNLIIGYLELEQKSLQNKLAEITFTEKRIHFGGRENIVEGKLITDSSQMFAPLQWELSSRFSNHNETAFANLNFHQKAEVESDRIVLYNNGKRQSIDQLGKLIHEFALIRLLYEKNFVPQQLQRFTFLENGLITKADHQLSPAPELNQTLDGRKLNCVLQTGYGINPIEYYLDENNFLLAAISCFNAKIYNPDAAEIYREFSKNALNRSFGH